MASECSQEAVLRFLGARGGRAKNVELMDHFKALLPSDPVQRAFAKERLRTYVDNVAAMHRENGAKVLCLRKRYVGCARRVEENADGDCNGNALGSGALPAPHLSEGPTVRAADGGARAPSLILPLQPAEFTQEDSLNRNLSSATTVSANPAGDARCPENAAEGAAEPEMPPSPGSGYRTEEGGGVGGAGGASHATGGVLERQLWKEAPEKGGTATAFQIRVSLESNSLEMGNIHSSKVKGVVPDGNKNICLSSNSSQGLRIPRITVIEASPLPVEAAETVFDLPESGRLNQECERFQRRDKMSLTPNQKEEEVDLQGHGRAPPEETEPKAKAGKDDRGAPPMQVIHKRRSSKGSQRGLFSSNASADGSDEGQVDSVSLCGSDTNTPRSSRKNFIQLMMNSSPQVRRSMVLKNNCCAAKSEGDAALTLPPVEDYGGSVALDPLEHEWMMCSSDGEWENLHRLLLREPNLVTKKDFVTGFTCLHWAAKLGKHELLAPLVNFAKQNSVPVNINVRSGVGYTPLHLAAMHNHLEVVRLLIEEYDADVEARDYSGKTASHYLTCRVPGDLWDLMRRRSDPCLESAEAGAGHWTPSKHRASGLMPLNLFNHPEEDVSDGESMTKPKPGNRKAAMNIIKPRLRKIRVRSKIVHSTSFREAEGGDGAPQNAVKSRPKSNLFG
ncbi:ankyrin repeat domain-containing protein SOWAHC [Scleropages formosus]|uniref:ankyrin repeat domain-containing protein SOWAHC n=1 Tax=Scleropages formosus TaxID=113540 RepID=UPI000878C402|nr:ankyrin repeat domain-containing protein SOWAHC-like [Scleropages formosus]